MAGPFKMKGSPMQRNFGIGSPLHQGLKKEGKQLKKTEIGPKAQPMVDKNKNEIPDLVESRESLEGKLDQPTTKPKGKGKPKTSSPPSMPKSHPVTPPSNKNKKKKKKKKTGWFGFKDQGITEALDAFTKKRNE